jgi:hypothetical protein
VGSDCCVFHGISQCPEGLKDNFAKLYTKKEDKSENRKRSEKEYKGGYGNFGYSNGRAISYQNQGIMVG